MTGCLMFRMATAEANDSGGNPDATRASNFLISALAASASMVGCRRRGGLWFDNQMTFLMLVQSTGRPVGRARRTCFSRSLSSAMAACSVSKPPASAGWGASVPKMELLADSAGRAWCRPGGLPRRSTVGLGRVIETTSLLSIVTWPQEFEQLFREWATRSAPDDACQLLESVGPAVVIGLLLPNEVTHCRICGL